MAEDRERPDFYSYLNLIIVIVAEVWLQGTLSSIVLSVCQEKLWPQFLFKPQTSMEVLAAGSGASAVVQYGMKAMVWWYDNIGMLGGEIKVH